MVIVVKTIDRTRQYCCDGNYKTIASYGSMFAAQILEWPHPYIDQDWASGQHRWREITPLTYQKLKTIVPLLKKTATAFMQAEPVDILPDGDGLYVCCKYENGFYFVRLLPGSDWWKRDYLPLPETTPLPQRLSD